VYKIFVGKLEEKILRCRNEDSAAIKISLKGSVCEGTN